jgi:AhpD family alkylhydroperoxidase
MTQAVHLHPTDKLMKTPTENPDAESTRAKVRESYGKIAVSEGSCCSATPNCCGSAPAAAEAIAQQIGYSAAELAALPDGANMGLSCGNPTALAALQAGEVMLDLGSGGGFDVFIAGRNVGPTGRAIGVDMTSEMLAKARKNIPVYRERSGLDNVAFRLGEIEHLPVADASVDVVISNCVINLSPDKAQVWREIARVLTPGGRVAVSDLALLKPLPPAVSETVEALIGCVAGAVTVTETERMAREAGLVSVVLKSNSDYIDRMVDWQDPLYRKIVAHLPAGAKASDYVTSLEITARKPVASAAAGAVVTAPPKPALSVYDPPMCCSTGVCGPEVEPALVTFASDLKWLQEQGVEVRRFGLAQNPAAFVENQKVREALTNTGESALPLVLVGDTVIASGRYPNRDELAASFGLASAAPSLFTPAVAELVAIGAAIAANCEPCLRFHVAAAEKLGVSKADMSCAVAMAAKVKDAPHRAVLRLAATLIPADPAPAGEKTSSCCGADDSVSTAGAGRCCG